ncbi:hypothetical protein [Deinococcus cellulosilyticus]|uniref:DUF2269 domain-containing protein n=1 Tax=Deinococcus cellulosilyticus (strain DSM 18568 / NBRC 106333 / KACC 11606 / 5516J-15) TaxID=1223518 RepID=A0A511N9N3_DEIC1|nr:hypothetical protein [Deinococcus cellulosilyticus]GEM49539.1 hypothetical protein DC3_51740 [Deinococcus cellulosilyticus NBRC 106333 = KACC 11606]
MKLTGTARKLLLTLHISTSVSWLGVAAGFFALTVAGQQDPALNVYPALNTLSRTVLFPLSVLTLTTGILQALLTPWGLWKHYWVVFKLFFTLIAALVMWNEMTTIAMLSGMATTGTQAQGLHQQGLAGLSVHSGVGALLLLGINLLSVLKPRGETGWGRRRKPNPQ